MRVCPKDVRHINRSDAQFCCKCGTKMSPPLKCGNCGSTLMTSLDKFCDVCGEPLRIEHEDTSKGA